MDAKQRADDIGTRAGDRKAVVFVSGGVDSAVAAALAKEALGKNAVYYFIDNGLQRENERKNIRALFGRIGIDVRIFDAAEGFLEKISGCESGNEKRAIIGELLVREALGIAKAEKTNVLVFGTIKNDLMVCSEDTVEIPGFEIIEPLKDMVKEDVVALAKEMNIPEEFWGKQHFPGAGFAVRIEGKVTKEKLALIKALHTIVEAKVREMDLDERLWGYFPFLLASKFEGKHVVGLRLVESELGLMAEIPELGSRQLIELRDKILKSKHNVGRVLFDLTPKPAALIELM